MVRALAVPAHSSIRWPRFWDTDATGLNELAQHHTVLYPIASRCGVFAKTDVQPLLNEGS